jgi:hypothetical protein
LLIDIVNLVNSDEFAVVKLEIPSLGSIEERLGHGYDNISKIMHLLVHPSYFEVKLL